MVKTLPGGTEAIGFLEYLKYNSWANYYMHKKITGKLSLRVKKHQQMNETLFNYYSQSNYHGNYVSWLENCAYPMVKATTMVEILYANAMNFTCMKIPTRTWELCLTELPTKRSAQLKGGIEKVPYGETHYSQGVFPMFYAVTGQRRPGKTVVNYLAARDGRLHIEVPGSHYMGEIDFGNFLDEWFLPDTKKLFDFDKDKWFQNLLPKQKSDIIRDRELYKGEWPKKVSLDIKSDETLHDNTSYAEQSEAKFVPRILFNLSGWWLDKMGPACEIIEQWMKDTWNKEGTGRIVKNQPGKNGYRVYVPFYTAGASSKDISYFYTKARMAPKDEFWFLVMGDDMASGTKESDFSKFDRTQSEEIIILLMNHLEKMGFQEMVTVWKHQYRVPKVMKHKKTNTNIVIQQKVGKMTGERPTSFSNSLFNIASTVYSHHEYTEDKIDKGYLDYGFIAKYFEKKYVSFLKGVFLEAPGATWQWVRKPSFIAKFGKTLTNWVNVTPKGNLPEKAAHMLWCQWLGYGDMRNNWFYAEFHLKLEKLCKRFLKELPGKENATKLEFWQIKGDTFDQYVSDGVWNQFMWEEYGVTIELQKDFLGFVDTIVALPVVYEHPLITILERKDYG